MPTQVIVPATRAVLTDPTDPGGAVVMCGTRRTSAAEELTDGAFDQYVGDQTQLRTFAMTSYTQPITFANLSYAEARQVAAWKGRTLLLRTVEGERLYGGFLVVNVLTILRAGPRYEADVSFRRVSATDAV